MRKIIPDVDSCYKKYRTSKDKQNHCIVSKQCRGWGCKYLIGIAFEHECFAMKYWYNIGHREGNIWKIDKDKIREILLKESSFLELNRCPVFDFTDVECKIDSLVDEIVPDGINWTFMQNADTGEIDMISHFEDFDSIDWNSLWDEAQK